MRIAAFFDDLSPCDAVLACDVDPLGRLVRLVDVGRTRFVERDRRREPVPALAHDACDLRVVENGVLLWPTADGSTLLLDTGVRPGPACEPREFFAARSCLFAAYSEQDILTGPDDTFAGDGVTVFDAGGTRLLGAASLLGSRKHDPAFIELTRGATHGDDLVFVADGSPCIWRLAPGSQSLSALLPARPIAVADHVGAVLLAADQVGLVTSAPDGLLAHWYRSGDGRAAGESLVPARALRVQRHGALGWHLRAVAGGGAITWDQHRVVLLSA